MKHFLGACAAACSGSLFPTALFLFLDPGSFAAQGLARERFFVIAAGNLLAAIVVGGIGAFRARGSSWNLWSGVAIGGASLAAAQGGPWSGAVALVLLLLGAVSLSRIRPVSPSSGALALGGLLAVMLPIGAWLWPANLHPLAALPRTSLPLQAQASAARGPNVLLIVADTLRADALLDPDVPTPNLDALRARGTWTKWAVAPCNQTVPSHLALLGAEDLLHLGMRGNLSNWPNAAALRERWNLVPLAERFRAAGWSTAGVATNPLLNMIPEGGQSFRQGFELWDPIPLSESFQELMHWKESHAWLGLMSLVPALGRGRDFVLRHLLNPHPVDGVRRHFREGERTTARVESALADLRSRGAPWFLFVNLLDPHTPYVAPPPYCEESPREEFALREELRERLSEAPRAAETLALARRLHRLYRAEVAYLDHVVGEILAAVARDSRPTLILFTADHGESFAEHGQMEHAHSLYEAELRVPLILAGPGVPAGKELGFHPALVDGGYTLLALAGAPTRAAAGRNLLSTTAPKAPETILSFMHDACAIRRGRWKAVFRLHYPVPPRPGNYRLELQALYDLDADPGEDHDLSTSAPRPAADLEKALRALLVEDYFPQLPPRILNTRERGQLQELGYVDTGN